MMKTIRFGLLLTLALPSIAGAQTVSSEDGVALLTATVGASLRTRNAHISASARRAYDVYAYPEVVVAVETRPFVTTVDGSDLARGFFAAVRFAHSAGLRSETMGNAIDTTNFLRLGLDIGWLGPVSDEVELGGGLGFVFDGSYLTDGGSFPSTEVAALRPLLRLRVRLVGEMLVVGGELAYRGALTVGGLDAFGTGWEAHGFDLGGSIGGHFTAELGAGFAWETRLSWVSWFLARSDSSAGASGGADHSLRLELLVGWAF